MQRGLSEKIIMSTYTKPYLTIDQQIDFIKNNLSCSVNDEESSKDFLRKVGFYKTQHYLSDLQTGKIPLNNKKDTISFEDVMFLYKIDREISGLFFTCITEIEVAIRSKFCDVLATDPFGYGKGIFWHAISDTETDDYEIKRSKIQDDWFNKLEDKVKDLEERHANDLGTVGCNCTSCKNKSQHCKCKKCNYNCICDCNIVTNPIVLHIKNNKPQPRIKLPLWISLELMDFGSLSYFYEGMSDNNRNLVSSSMKLDCKILSKILKSLNILRNYCAHNNKIIGNITFAPPKIFSLKELYPNASVVGSTSNVFCLLLTCYYFVKILKIDIKFIKDFYNSINNMVMYNKYNFDKVLGIDSNWKNCTIW